MGLRESWPELPGLLPGRKKDAGENRIQANGTAGRAGGAFVG
ncbi:hypothetical protein Daudx_2261 [Candidatus Desulforudis audaxviator]|nr:hypothetical protein Daudx_2261 [Candidatus Desulforudis audaxviator]